MHVRYASHRRPSGDLVTILTVEDGQKSSVSDSIDTHSSLSVEIVNFGSADATFTLCFSTKDCVLTHVSLVEDLLPEATLESDNVPLCEILGPGATYLDEQTIARALMQICQNL